MSLRSVVKNAGVYGLVDIISKIVAIVTMPLFTHYFTPAEYGQISLIATIVALMGTFGNPGLSSAMHRYFNDRNAQDGSRKTMVSTGAVMIAAFTVAMNIAAIVIALAASGWVNRTMGLPSAIVVFAMIANLPGPLLQYAQDITRIMVQPWRFTGIALARGLLGTLLAAILAVGLNGGMTGYYAGIAIAFIIATIIAFIQVKDVLGARFDRDEAKNLISFGYPLLCSSLVTLVLTLSDRWMISLILGPEQTGYYGAASQLGMATAIFASAIAQSWPPYVMAHWNDREKFSVTAGRALTYLFAGMSALAVMAGLFASEAMMIFTPKAYWDTAMVIPLLAAATAVMATTQVTMIGLTYTKNSGLIFIGTVIAAIVNIIGNLALIPLLGVAGAAIGTIAGYTALTAFYTYWLHRFYPIGLQKFRLAAIAGALTFSLFALWAMMTFIPWSIGLLLTKIALVAVAAGLAGVKGYAFWKTRNASPL